MFGSGDLGMGVTFSLRDNATQNAQNAGRALTNLERTVSQASQNIQNAANRIQTGIIGVVLAVGMMIGPFAMAVNESGEFNFQISQAGAIARATAPQLEMLRQKAIQLGDATIFSAVEIAKAEVNLSRAGFAVEQQLELLPGLTSLAAAGNISLEQSALMASNALYMFGLRAGDMPHVADVLVNAANKSNQTLENFSNAIRYLGPTAKALDVTLEESAGYIMMMANSAMRGSIGTRAFGTSLANLANPTKMAKEAMAELGFSVFDKGAFVGFTEMTRRLDSALRGYSKESRLMYLDKIFGSEAIQEINTLLEQEYRAIENGTEVVYKGADALEYFTKINRESAGVAEQTAKDILNNFKGDVILFTSVWETTKIAIGVILEETLRPFVKEMTEWLVTIKQFIQTPFGEWLVKIAAGLATAGSMMIILGFATTILVPAIWSMVTAVGALMIELAPFIATAAIIVGVIVLLKRSFDEFQAVMNNQTGPAAGFMGIMQKIGGVIMSVIEVWSTWNGETFTLSQGLHDALQRIGILDFVLNLATWIVRIKEFFSGLVEGVVLAYVITEAAFIRLRESFGTFFDVLEQIGLPLGKLMGDLGLFRALGRVVSGAVTIMLLPLNLLLDVIKQIVDGFSWLIDNGGELMKLFNKDAWTTGIIAGLSTGDWSMMPGANFKDTVGDGKMLPGSNAPFVPSIGQRQAEIMTMMGMRTQGQATIPAPPGSGLQETFIMPIYLDSEKIAEEVRNKEQLKNSRQ